MACSRLFSQQEAVSPGISPGLGSAAVAPGSAQVLGEEEACQLAALSPILSSCLNQPSAPRRCNIKMSLVSRGNERRGIHIFNETRA